MTLPMNAKVDLFMARKIVNLNGQTTAKPIHHVKYRVIVTQMTVKVVYGMDNCGSDWPQGFDC